MNTSTEPLERDIESKIVNWLKGRGLKHTKLQGMTNRGLPDRVIWLSGGQAIFMEIKRPSGKLTELQRLCHEELAELGYPVAVIRSLEAAIEFVETWLNKLSEPSGLENNG